MLTYKRFGQGERKVLALHGWLGDERFLDPMRHALDESAFEYAVPAYRGYGSSAAIEGRYTLDELARDLGELVEALGWSRFSILGHSMGGLIGQRLLLDHGDRVEKLVGVAPVPASGAGLDAQTIAMFRAATTDMGVRRAIMDFSTGNRLSSAWLDYATGLTDLARADAMDGYLTVFASSNIADQVHGLELPVMVMAGANEPGDSTATMRATYLHHFPNAELEVLPNVGHCPIDEAPLHVAAVTERFLKRA